MIKLVKILPSIFFLSMLLGSHVQAASILNKSTLTTEKGSVQIFLRLSELPAYSHETIGKRVDIVLSDTLPAKDFKLLATNNKMIKMLSKRHNNQLRLSFYFRYPPQNVTIRQTKETSSLMLDILLGNPFSAQYPDLSSRLHGITMLNRDEIDFTNPIHASAYGEDWKLFIKNYESGVDLRPQQRLTLPPFPLAATLPPEIPLKDWLPGTINSLARGKAWSQVSMALRTQLELESDEAKRKRLLLSYAESLVRDNRYREPYKLLQQISLTYPDTPQDIHATLLFLYLIATHGDTHLAYIHLTELKEEIPSDYPFTSFINILQAELAIDTQRIEVAAEILKQGDVAYIGEADSLRLLRQADTYYLSGDQVKALIAYSRLNEQTGVIDRHPAALARFSDTLYTHKRFTEAAEQYQILTKLLSGTDTQHLAMFRLAMSRLHAGNKWTKIFPLFNQIQDAYPGTEGAYRARLRLTDLYFLESKARDDQTAAEYGAIGVVANQIPLREEALLKQAMINGLAGKHETSIDQAMDILRSFRHGDLTLETKSLILSQLSGVLKSMIDEKKYVAALVLAKQNRLFFARGWLDSSLLYDLARAYVQLGVYDRAIRAYLYILDVSSGEEREKVYEPMLKALFESGQYLQVEDYANRYFFRFSDGQGAAAVFLLRIKALQKSNNLDLATRLLDAPDRPSSPEIERTASRIYFELQQWDKVIELLSTDNNSSAWIAAERDYLLAESLFQAGQGEKSRPLFERLQEEDPYIELAMFRLAELAVLSENPKEALKQFQKLAEKGPRRVSPLFIPKMISNIGTAEFAIKYNLRGINFKCPQLAANSQ